MGRRSKGGVIRLRLASVAYEIAEYMLCFDLQALDISLSLKRLLKACRANIAFNEIF